MLVAADNGQTLVYVTPYTIMGWPDQPPKEEERKVWAVSTGKIKVKIELE